MEPRIPLPYASPRAFDAALTARFKKLSTERPHSVSQLRRQFAYDRALARCFTGPSRTRWVLKGGISILALLRDARHSADLDMAADMPTASEALQLLQTSLEQELGDHFTFQVGSPSRLIQGVEGVRVPLTALLGPRPYERFHLDLVIGVVPTGKPESAASLVPIGVPGLEQPPYQLYPLCDTLADKICAINEWHGDRPSTRFRDLVDIVLIAKSRSVEAVDLGAALAAKHVRRKLEGQTALGVADEAVWLAGYSKASATAPGIDGYRDLGCALDLARAFVNPIFDGTVRTGRWSPALLRWDTRSSPGTSRRHGPTTPSPSSRPSEPPAEIFNQDMAHLARIMGT